MEIRVTATRKTRAYNIESGCDSISLYDSSSPEKQTTKKEKQKKTFDQSINTYQYRRSLGC
jgi:hypothetical protein